MAAKDYEYCLQAVPHGAKKSSISIAFILIGLTLFSASMWTGGALSRGGMILDQFLPVLLIGNLILGVYSATLGYIGAKTGLSTHLLSRFSFGKKGSWFPSLLLSITQIGWFGVGLAMFSYPISRLIHIDVHILIIIFGMVMTFTVALEGIKGLVCLSLIAVPTVIIISCYSIWVTMDQIGGSSTLITIKSKEPFSINSSIIIISSFISIGLLTTDLVKFGGQAKSPFFCTICVLLFINGLMFMFTPAGNIYLLIAIFGLMMALTVLLEGFKGLFYLSAIAVPIIITLGGYSIWHALKNGINLSAATINNSQEPISFSNALTIIIGSFISAGTLIADFLRFGQPGKHIFFIIIFSFLFGNSLMFLFGAAGVMSMGLADISDIMIAQGMSILAIIVLGLNIWTTNNDALYTSGLGMANITGLPSKCLSIINGLLGTLCATWIYHHFIGWLTFLSTAIPPIGGIIIADYILYNKNYSDLSYSHKKQINWTAFVVIIISITSAHYLPGIVPLNAIMSSSISYIMINLIIKFKNNRLKQPPG